MDASAVAQSPESSGRRREFRAALALKGQTAVEFAKTLNISTNHLGLVLRGERQSKRIAEAVDALIASAFE